MKWLTPPVLQGQVIEQSYASSCDGRVWMCRKDRAEQTEKYFVAYIDDECFDPANSVPKGFDWKPCLSPE